MDSLGLTRGGRIDYTVTSTQTIAADSGKRTNASVKHRRHAREQQKQRACQRDDIERKKQAKGGQ